MANEIATLTTEDLTQHEIVDLNIATAALTAFWQAVEANQNWWHDQGFRPVINCCVLSALAVQDILHGMGHIDAIVVKSGLHLQRFEGGKPYHSVTIGSPSTPSLPGLVNAHMVVKLGNLIIDPTIGQVRRSWNDIPKSAVIKTYIGSGRRLQLTDKCSVHVTAQHTRRSYDHDLVLSYFKPSFTVDRKTRKWRTAPDTNYERRARFVETALAITNTSTRLAA